MTGVRVDYDAEADAAYLFLLDPIDDDAVTTTDAVALDGGARLLVEHGPDGRLLGIEVQQASRRLPHDLLRRLVPPAPHQQEHPHGHP